MNLTLPLIRRSLLVIAVASFGCFTASRAPAQSPTLAGAQTPPFWVGNEMPDDPLLFIRPDGAASATAKLLFPADGSLRITSMDGRQVYEPNRDYTWQPGSDTVTLTANTRIPSKTHQEMFPPVDGKDSFGTTADGKSGVLFGDGRFFYDLHVRASYHHTAKWTGAIPPGPSPNLTRTRAKLAAHESLKIVMLGDSISVGHSASAMFDAAPRLPGYFNRVKTYLGIKFDTEIDGVNLSLSGRAAAWGESQVDKVLAEKPDLVLLAFGMNDGESGIEYLASLDKVIKPVQAAFPNVEFILVSPMTGNPDVKVFGIPHFKEYRDALLKVQGPGKAVADVTTVWIDLLKQKKFVELSGNGVNHPNDFGHEVYADVIEALF